MPEAQLGPFNGTAPRLGSPQMSELDTPSLSVTLLSLADKHVDRYEHHGSVCVWFVCCCFCFCHKLLHRLKKINCLGFCGLRPPHCDLMKHISGIDNISHTCH